MNTWNWRLPKALLLDIDNTVYSYEPCHAAGLKSAFEHSRRFELWQGEEAFLAAYGEARRAVKSRIDTHAAAHSRLLYFKEMIEARIGFTEFERVRRIDKAYWDGYASRLVPEPGCQSVLQQALQAGIRLAWISNFTTGRQIWKLTRLGLDDMKAVLVTSEEAGADKPDPAILDLALDRLGIGRQTLDDDAAWIIGDEAADAAAAHSRGLPVLVLRREGAGASSDSTRRRTVHDWPEIGEVLKHARN